MMMALRTVGDTVTEDVDDVLSAMEVGLLVASVDETDEEAGGL